MFKETDVWIDRKTNWETNILTDGLERASMGRKRMKKVQSDQFSFGLCFVVSEFLLESRNTTGLKGITSFDGWWVAIGEIKRLVDNIYIILVQLVQKNVTSRKKNLWKTKGTVNLFYPTAQAEGQVGLKRIKDRWANELLKLHDRDDTPSFLST